MEATNAKRIRLTVKEIVRAEVGYFNNRSYTIIVRPQAVGGYMVAVVWLDTEELDETAFVDDASDIPNAIYNLNRDLDKFTNFGGKMSDASRHRSGPKHDKLVAWNCSMDKDKD